MKETSSHELVVAYDMGHNELALWMLYDGLDISEYFCR